MTYSIVALDSADRRPRRRRPVEVPRRRRRRAVGAGRRRRDRHAVVRERRLRARTGSALLAAGATAERGARAGSSRPTTCATSGRSASSTPPAAPPPTPAGTASPGPAAGPGPASRRRATSWPAPAVVDGLADTFLAGRPAVPRAARRLPRRGRRGGRRPARPRIGGAARRPRGRRLRRRQRPLDRPAGRPPRRPDRRAGPPARAAAPVFRSPAVERARTARRGDGRGAPDAPPVDRRRAGRPVRGRLRAHVRDAGRRRPVRARRSGSRGRSRPIWDERWQRALDDWMAVENLEERAAAPGWIDPRVLAILRSRAAGWRGAAQPGRRPDRHERPPAGRPAHARGDRDRHGDAVPGLDRRRARRTRLDAEADRLDARALGPHRRQRRRRARTRARTSPSTRWTASG